MKHGNIRHSAQLPVKSRGTGEIFTFYRGLTEGSGLTSFCVLHEELRPGHRGSPPHCHSVKDEMYLILKGSLAAYVGGAKLILTAGDYVIFEGGAGESHYLINESAESAEMLTISSSAPADVVTYSDEPAYA